MDHIKEAIEWTRACAYLTFRRYRPLWRAMWVPRAAGTKVAREALLDFWNVYLASTQQGRLSTAQWTNQVKMAASDLTRSWHTEARGFTDYWIGFMATSSMKRQCVCGGCGRLYFINWQEKTGTADLLLIRATYT
jgi:hypothetical protein